VPEFDVEVEGGEPPRRRGGPIWSVLSRINALLNRMLLRPRLVLAGGVILLFLVVGTPHFGWDYVCRHPMRGGQPCRAIEYCAYYGMQGRRLDFPEPGEQCHFVRLMPVQWGKLVGLR